MGKITKERAQEIANSWHGGQWSALYSFGSTGEIAPVHVLQYFKELWMEIEPEYWHAREVSRSQRSIKELKALTNYLLAECKKLGYEVEFTRDKQYGYQVPYLAESVPDKLAENVMPVSYMR